VKTNPTTIKYLERRADLARPVTAGPLDGVEQVVVIPVLAEEEYVYRTLASLARNPEPERERTLVLCVINSRRDSPRGDIEANRRTLDRLRRLIRGAEVRTDPQIRPGELRIGLVDAVGRGREVSGVGEARRIGLDRALAILADRQHVHGALISLDADTTVAGDYLPVIRRHFSDRRRWAAVVEFEHPLPEDHDARDVIVQYESFLRYHTLGLKLANSPYAFPTIGSTMVCRGDAYAAVSGMNRRRAAEDFYFLQELQKTGGVEVLTSTRVYPSARASERVPFGTGMAVVRGLGGGGGVRRVYHPTSYRIIGDWLAVAAVGLDGSADALLVIAESSSCELARYLRANRFEEVWPRLRRNASSTAQLRAQFHRWFDGFRTLRLIHHLRDNGYPDQPLYEALEEIVEWAGGDGIRDKLRAANEDHAARVQVLEALRELQRRRYSDSGNVGSHRVD